MSTRGWPYLALMAIAAATAVGCAMFLISGGGSPRPLLIVISFAIAAGLLGAVLFMWSESASNAEDRRRMIADIRNDFIQIDQRVRAEHDRNTQVTDQLIDLRGALENSNATIATGFQELRGSYSQLADQLRDGISSMQQQQVPYYPPQPSFDADAYYRDYPQQEAIAAPESFLRPSYEEDSDVNFEQQFAAEAPPAPPEPEPVPETAVVDQLITTLEPVVDLFTNKTAHYRLLLSMTKPDGEEVPTDTLLHHADRSGLRTAFDVHATEEALGLLRHLRQRDGQLNIFMPIGASSLNSAETVNRILAARSKFKDVSQSLVIELPHALLAGLSEKGLEGLATLARNGCVLALSNVSIAGIELASMARLNVRYASLNASTVLANNGPSPNVMTFAQLARANRVMTIVTQVLDDRETKKLMRVARFACGPGYAAPRRVKSGVAKEPVERMGAAA